VRGVPSAFVVGAFQESVAVPAKAEEALKQITMVDNTYNKSAAIFFRFASAIFSLIPGKYEK